MYKKTWYLDNVGSDRGKDLIYFFLDLKRGGESMPNFFRMRGSERPPHRGKFFLVCMGVDRGAGRVLCGFKSTSWSTKSTN